MYIYQFQVFNYKSFKESGLLEFKPGINIIVGQNNAGKTALLEALELGFKNKPHHNIIVGDAPPSKNSNSSTVDVSFTVEKSEIRTLIEQERIGILDNDTDRTLSLFQEWLENTKPVEILVSNCSNDPEVIIADFPEDINLCKIVKERLGVRRGRHPMRTISFNEKGKFQLDEDTVEYDYTHSFEKAIFYSFKSKIYRFYAERFHVGSGYSGNSSTLKPTAGNLAEVISVLQLRGKKKIYGRFNQYINTIFPEIKMVSTRPLAQKSIHTKEQKLEVLVWSPEADDRDDEDLALPLADCGTGVSQVLAILYVVVTSSEPQVIIIDEPQSFLHPSCVRKLIEILKEFPQHQYFIATHSPLVISAANPATILQLSYSGGETKAQIIDAKKTTELRSLLKEVGVSLSDIFGADAILWVEGPTEEKCFPLILDKIARLPMRGMEIMAVKNTGDLEGKRARIVFDIYDKLSGGNSLFPPAIGFILDAEKRTTKQKEEIQKRHAHIDFLQRRTYENYLLHPRAIAAILNEEDTGKMRSIDVLEIEEWIDKAYNQNNGDIEAWKEQVNAPKILEEAFSQFSENRVEYRKTIHSLKITEWLIENQPDSLSELANFLKKKIEKWREEVR